MIMSMATYTRKARTGSGRYCVLVAEVSLTSAKFFGSLATGGVWGSEIRRV